MANKIGLNETLVYPLIHVAIHASTFNPLQCYLLLPIDIQLKYCSRYTFNSSVLDSPFFTKKSSGTNDFLDGSCQNCILQGFLLLN